MNLDSAATTRYPPIVVELAKANKNQDDVRLHFSTQLPNSIFCAQYSN